MSCCGTKIEARRNGDLRITYTPSSRKFSFSGLQPTMTIRLGATTLLTIGMTPTINGSVWSIVGDSMVVTILMADIALLDSATPDTEMELLNYDIVVIDQTGLNDWLLGGPFVVLGLNDVSCGTDCGDVEVSLSGQCVSVSIEGGNVGAASAVILAELNQAVADAEAAAQAAEDAATAAAAAAASIPPLLVNKADTDGGNILKEEFRIESEVVYSPPPEVFGGVGNGVADDRGALIASGTANVVAPLTASKVYYFGDQSSGADDPLFMPYGSGKLKWSDVELGGYRLDFNVERESIWSTPDSWFHATRRGASVSPEYPPYAPPGRTDLASIFNTVVSQRSALQSASRCENTTAFGSNIGVRANEWSFTDAFGADAMMFAYLSDRNTALGTETMVWLAAPDRQYLIDTNHDFYRTIPPNLWTPGNNELEALFPGIGLQIYNYANYATDRTQVTANTAVGRDALCHMTRGVNNVSLGYQAGVMLWEGSDNSFLGPLSGRNIVFGSNNTAVGGRALFVANASNQATGVGWGAMRSAKTASNSVGVGYLCGDGVEITTGSVLLGTRAGAAFGGSLQNKFVLGNADITTRRPLMSGDFTTGRVGVNIPIGTERSNFHVRSGVGSGASPAQENGLLIEGDGPIALSLESPTGGTTGINFGTATLPTDGRIEYAGGSNQMLFKANGAFRLRIASDGTLRPETANTQNLGSIAQPWLKLFANSARLTNLPVHADNAAAITAGLAVGDVYRTATGQVMVRF